MAEKMSGVATVEKVDAKHRQLTLKDDQGNLHKVDVPESVTNFDAIKKGDKISIDYFASVTLGLKKGGESGKPSSDRMVEHVAGPLPGGLVARQMSVTAEVVKVDSAGNMVTIKGPNGELDTIRVSEPEMQADLAKLKKGDKIQATYTEAVALSITPQNKKS